MKIRVTDVRVNPGDSAFLLDDGKTAILYDTGFGFTGFGVAENIKKHLGERNLDYIFLTHSHYDHALGSAYILHHYPDAKVVASQHTADVFKRPGAIALMKDLDAKYAAVCGVTDYPFLGDQLRVDIAVADGDTVQAGEHTFEVLSLPGHTHCSIGFYLKEEKLLLACESMGVYLGEGTVVPAVLVGCGLSLQSIDRVRDLDIRHIVAPHCGFLNETHTKLYLGACRDSVQGMIGFIAEKIQNGVADADILSAVSEHYGYEQLQDRYPKAAAELNTSIMIRLVHKEKFGE